MPNKNTSNWSISKLREGNVGSGSSGRVRGGGARNMKSMLPPLSAIHLFYDLFLQGHGEHGPSAPPDPLLNVFRGVCLSMGGGHERGAMNGDAVKRGAVKGGFCGGGAMKGIL